MGNWIETTIGEFCPFEYGSGLKGENRKLGNVPVYGSNGIVGYHNEALVNTRGVIIGRKGTIGAVNYSNRPFFPIDTTFYVSETTDKDIRFIYYLLKSSGLENMNSDSAVPGLNRLAAHSRIIKVPDSLDDQRAISNVLGTLDDKIELNREINKILEAMAQAVFRKWFIENEEIKNWNVVPLSEAIEVNPTRTLKKGDIAPYLDMANMPTQGHRAIEWVDRPFGSGTKFISGDTLLARITPCLENGKTAFVDFLQDGQVGWGSTEYIVFHPKPPLPPEYGYYLARSEELRNYAIINMTGTSGRQRTPASCFDSYMITVPPAQLAENFGEFAKSIMEKIKINDEEIRTLVSLRNTLLPKLLSGEVSVL
jgi:type I restriction enzyme S subunit